MTVRQGGSRTKLSRSILLGVLLPAALGVGVGLAVWRLVKQPSADTPSGSQAQAIGQFASASALQVRVNKVQTDNVGDTNFLPGTDRTFYILDISVRNTASQSLWVTPVTQAYLKDSAGARYEMYPAPEDRVFVAGELRAGEERQGQISFSVPQTATGLVLYYSGEPGAGTAVIDLGRK